MAANRNDIVCVCVLYIYVILTNTNSGQHEHIIHFLLASMSNGTIGIMDAAASDWITLTSHDLGVVVRSQSDN